MHPLVEYYENMTPSINNIDYYNYVLEDNCLYANEIIQYSKEILNLIGLNSDKNILIHCNEGQSRSVSVIIYYLMKKHNYTFDDASEYIQNIKSDAKPNSVFQKKLHSL